MKKRLRILLSSHLFYPSIGGTEDLSAMLADGFVAQGHEVKVITQSVANEADHFSYEVNRRPSWIQLLKLVKWCDVYFQNNISLQTAWPLLIVRRRWVIGHQIWITRPDGERGWQDCLKRFVLRFADNIAACDAVAADLPCSSKVIGNPYRADLFRQVNGICRDRALVFVGRLVSDKGVDLLIEALGRLKSEGLEPELTIVGTGPELEPLRALAECRQVSGQVSFVGVKRNEELVELLNRHRIMVIPSKWKEPFGLVALLGIACGCVPIGSEGGGLKDAIGPCGRTFENGSLVELTRSLSDLLRNSEQIPAYLANAREHLDAHSLSSIAAAYLDVLQSGISRK